jgi:hypothetical protein
MKIMDTAIIIYLCNNNKIKLKANKIIILIKTRKIKEESLLD